MTKHSTHTAAVGAARVTAGYFTTGRVERLFRHSQHHYGRFWVRGCDGIGCTCCGQDILAPRLPPEQRLPGHLAVQVLCDALAEHLRTDCPHADDAPGYLDDHPEEDR